MSLLGHNSTSVEDFLCSTGFYRLIVPIYYIEKKFSNYEYAYKCNFCSSAIAQKNSALVNCG